MTFITANMAILEALKPLVNNAIWPFVRPPDADDLPYIVYSPISNNPLSTLEGWTGDGQIRMQIDVYAEAFSEAEELSKRLIPIIENLESVSATVQDGGTSGYETETRLFRCTVEFLVWEKVYER